MLNLGADDYITKPFSPRAMIAADPAQTKVLLRLLAVFPKRAKGLPILLSRAQFTARPC